MIEMQVGQNHMGNVLFPNAQCRQGFAKDVFFLYDPVTAAQISFKKHADSGFQKYFFVLCLDEERTTSEANAVFLIRRKKTRPQRLWSISKHRTSIQTLRVAHHCGKPNFTRHKLGPIHGRIMACSQDGHRENLSCRSRL